jgi:hypothetical protein
MIEIKNIKQTCDACPSQWVGETKDGKPIYIRYRWGYLSFRLGEVGQTNVVDYKELLGEQIGDAFDGSLETWDMLDIIQNIARLI